MIKINFAKRRLLQGSANEKIQSKSIFSSISLTESVPFEALLGVIILTVVLKLGSDHYKKNKLDSFVLMANDKKVSLDLLKKKLSSLRDVDRIRAQLERDEAILRERIVALEILQSKRKSVSAVIQGLTESAPIDLWFRSLKIDRSQVLVVGNSPDVSLVTDFVKNLSTNSLLENVTISSSKRESPQKDLQLFEVLAKRVSDGGVKP